MKDPGKGRTSNRYGNSGSRIDVPIRPAMELSQQCTQVKPEHPSSSASVRPPQQQQHDGGHWQAVHGCFGAQMGVGCRRVVPGTRDSGRCSQGGKTIGLSATATCHCQARRVPPATARTEAISSQSVLTLTFFSVRILRSAVCDPNVFALSLPWPTARTACGPTKKSCLPQILKPRISTSTFPSPHILYTHARYAVMPPSALHHRRAHNLLLINKLLDQRDATSPFTLLLDSVEQSGRPLVREYIRRAKVRIHCGDFARGDVTDVAIGRWSQHNFRLIRNTAETERCRCVHLSLGVGCEGMGKRAERSAEGPTG